MYTCQAHIMPHVRYDFYIQFGPIIRYLFSIWS